MLNARKSMIASLIPVCLLSLPVFLAGCGEDTAAPAKQGSAAVTPSIEENQKQMENFMKNQGKK
jgi:hypothetical protein